MDKLIDLMPLALAALFLYRARPARPLSSFNGDYLDIVPCRTVRAFYAFVIIFHHLSQHTESGMLFPVFRYLGFTVVIFFFLSGYGLMKKLMSDKSYGKSFIIRRLPPLLLPLLFVFLVFRLLYALGGEKLSLSYFFFLIVNGDIIMCIFWYMITLSLFYILFGISAAIFKRRPRPVFFAMAVSCLFYIVLGIVLGYGQWWYMSCHLLIVGMGWALYEDKLLVFIRKFYWPCLLLFGLAFLITWKYFDALFALRPTMGTRLAISLVRNLVFTVAFVLFTMKIKLHNPIMGFLGNISFELYMLHPIFLFTFRSSLIYIGSDVLYCLAVLASTIVSAKLLNGPYNALCKKYSVLIKQ